MLSIQTSFEKQGFSVAWRGDEPVNGAVIGVAYLFELVDGLPRANLADDDSLDGLDIGQLQTDYDAQIIIDAAAKLVSDDIDALCEAGKDIALVLTELVQWTLDNTAMLPTDFTESVKDAYLDLKVIADRVK